MCSVAKSCPALLNPLDCSPPGSSARGILQARILEWVTMPSSRNIFMVVYDSFVGKESVCNAGDPGSIPGSRRSPGEVNGNPLQYSCLENPTDRGAWQVTVHEVTQTQTKLKRLSMHAQLHLLLFSLCLCRAAPGLQQGLWLPEASEGFALRGCSPVLGPANPIPGPACRSPLLSTHDSSK